MNSRPPTSGASSRQTRNRVGDTDEHEHSGSISSSSSVFSAPETQPRMSMGSSDFTDSTPRHIIPTAAPSALQHRESLRIELPTNVSTGTSISADASQSFNEEQRRAPQTTTMPRSPLALSRGVSEFVIDPNTAAILQEFRAQQSTMALLSADLTSKSLMEASRARPGASPARRPADSSVGPTRKRGTSFGLFRRTQRGSSNTPSFLAAAAAAGATNATDLRRISGSDDGPLSPDATARMAHDEPAEASLDGGGRRHSTHGHESAKDAPGNCSSTSNDDPTGAMEGKGDGDREGVPVGLENVLKKASDVHGLRLTWILYAMICIVIGLFIMLFIQITYMTNGTLKETGREAVQTKVSSLANNAEMLVSELRYFYELAFRVMLVNESGVTSESLQTAAHDLCSRIFGAPIAVNLYNGTGAFVRRVTCSGEMELPIYDNVPHDNIVSTDGPRLVIYSDDVIAAYRSVVLPGESPEGQSTISVFMKRQTIGQFLLSNAIAQYSSATMQDVYTAVVLPRSLRVAEPGTLDVAVRTLDDQTQNYTAGAHSPTTVKLLGEFTDLCAHSNAYMWQKVLRPLELNLNTSNAETPSGDEQVQSITSVVPPPYMEFHSVWGLLSKTVQCGVVCSHQTATVCTADNPTSIYMMARYSVRANGRSGVTIVAAVSIAAVIVFSLLLVLAYFSISTPVHFLRYQILRIIGVDRKRTRLQKNGRALHAPHLDRRHDRPGPLCARAGHLLQSE